MSTNDGLEVARSGEYAPVAEPCTAQSVSRGTPRLDAPGARPEFLANEQEHAPG